MDWIAIGKRIRKQREYLGYTREEMAERIDVTPKFCSDIEPGIKGMSVPTLCRLCKFLNLSADSVLFGTENEDDLSCLSEMIKRCPADKRLHLESIVRTFLFAIDP